MCYNHLLVVNTAGVACTELWRACDTDIGMGIHKVLWCPSYLIWLLIWDNVFNMLFCNLFLLLLGLKTIF